jgi:hypothetical protein
LIRFRHPPRIIVAQARLPWRADGLDDARPIVASVNVFLILILAGRNTVNSSSFPLRNMSLAWLALPFSLLLAASASAQGVPLGTAGDFGVLAGSEVTNTGSSVVYGSIGVWPGTSVGGFPPGTIFPGSGTIHSADTVAQQAEFDLGVAYDDASSRACGVNVAGGLLGGLVLTPGVYCMDSADLTGTLTLDGAGLYVFKMASGLITAPGSSVVMINGAGSCDVFWQVTSSAAIDTTSQMVGTILALTSITLNTNASLSGRALARNALVSLAGNNITQCTIGGGAVPTTLTTRASAAVAIGGLIHDTAFLSGGVNPTGTITFDLYGPGDTTCAGPSLFTSVVPVNGNGSYDSADFTALIVGTYQWVASSSGDVNNDPAVTACNDPNESVTVGTAFTATQVLPTLSEWALALLASLLVLVSVFAVRRRAGH